MPKIYRSMLSDGDFPMIGDTAKMLGVRVPTDIAPDQDGNVHRADHGMSVAPSIGFLPHHRVPRRLNHIVKSATGGNDLCIWSTGRGDFVESLITDELELRLGGNLEHGFVSPSQTMQLVAYRDALSSTRHDWGIDES